MMSHLRPDALRLSLVCDATARHQRVGVGIWNSYFDKHGVDVILTPSQYQDSHTYRVSLPACLSQPACLSLPACLLTYGYLTPVGRGVLHWLITNNAMMNDALMKEWVAGRTAIKVKSEEGEGKDGSFVDGFADNEHCNGVHYCWYAYCTH